MSAPSFSSFPPSFASFPDLDSDQLSPSPPNEKKKRDGDGGKIQKDKKRKRHQYKDSVGHPNPESAKQKGESILILDDERLKTEEDRKRRDGDETITNIGRSGSPLLFHSDRRGDPLNVRYGGLHSGDIPKHHLVGCKPTPCPPDDILMMVKMAGKYLDCMNIGLLFTEVERVLKSV